MLKRHLENRLTYLRHHLTHAVTEGLNSKIQSLKSAARDFPTFKITGSGPGFFAASSTFTHYDP
jgi:hypothetical protein